VLTGVFIVVFLRMEKALWCKGWDHALRHKHILLVIQIAAGIHGII
jgi:hypothetical protein